MKRCILLTILILFAAWPRPVHAYPGPPLAPGDRFCAVARGGPFTLYASGYVHRDAAVQLTLAVTGGATVIYAGAPLSAMPAPAGADPALTWYTLTLPRAALAAPLPLTLARGAATAAVLVPLLHPACDHTPLPAPPAAPRYQAHIVQPDDLNPAWSPEELRTLRDAGLPVPATTTALVNVFAAAPPQPAAAARAPAQSDAGWTPLLRTGFAAGWPWAGRQQACRLVQMSDAPGLRWRAHRDSLMVAGHPGAAPGERVVQLACVFDGLADAHNLMAQFRLQLDPAAAGASFFAGFSNDGRNFAGRRWYTADMRAAAGPPLRLFLPFAGAQAAAGRLAVLWEYRQAAAAPGAPAVRLSDLAVERFDPPALGCRDLDPAIRVPGAPGGGQVSKGLNLPPYPDATPSGLAGHVARLRASRVNWARIELQATVDAAGLAGRGGQLGYIDLKHYDTLFHLLCAGEPPIAVLGLLGYHMLPDDAWRSGRAAESYRLGFTGLTATLARYFHDRVRAWEVWNEPDHPSTYLAPEDFARLLAAAYATVKEIDAGATVVLGGLSGAGPAAASYLRRTLAALPADSPGYDALGLHPYPSTEFRRGGATIRDPSYLRSYAPTVVARFMEAMRAAGHANRPIWVTELGWNRGAESTSPATANCQRIAATMVSAAEQAAYLPESFDLLFRETGWDEETPGVVKIFWYQYGDVGLATNVGECNGRAPGGAAVVVDWWYGLYSGADPALGVAEPQPNPVECTFRAYPDAAALTACWR